MMRAPRMDDWLRNQEAAVSHLQGPTNLEVKRRDDESWESGEKHFWSHATKLQRFEWILRNTRGVPQEKLDWLCSEVRGFTVHDWFNAFCRGSPTLIGYGGYPFPQTDEEWLSEDVRPRYADATSDSNDLVFSNRDAMRLVFNKIINDKCLMIDFCVASGRSGGKWQFWPLVDRYMNCFTVNELMMASDFTFEEFNARYLDEIAMSPPSDYEMSGTTVDLSNVRDDEDKKRPAVVPSPEASLVAASVVAPSVASLVPVAASAEVPAFASLPTSGGNETVENQGLETQPRVKEINNDGEELEFVRAVLVDQFDAVSNDSKVAAMKKKSRKRKKKHSKADDCKPAANNNKKSKSVMEKKQK
ncbi:hypothetical protein SEMRO_1964_G308170.1 [Seminavis robusta]|uniref:Uncharacterized protein n=1 Tax=Seminavis robusta TaxID=568900 RepID=A0A9N8EWG6_9STRA|nr:hypothetical protein SEMRO_1964_G308170.1 [Seminavis robusta]|eukprot:Sro1964_g308170.1 n/a (359) ;mRNA; f:4880-6031